MANQLNCLRCGAGMQFIRREKFQLGQTGWVLGDLPNLFAGAMEIEIYVCPKCGKPTREAHQILKDGSKVRICKKCGETI